MESDLDDDNESGGSTPEQSPFLASENKVSVISTRQQSCRKIMFSQVCHSVHSGVVPHKDHNLAGTIPTPQDHNPPPRQLATASDGHHTYGRQVGGTCPTGMHSYYRPQRKFAKVMFLHLSVSHSVHGGGGVCLSACWDTPPREQTPTRPCSACWEIRATSGRYASYWNAYLFVLLFQLLRCLECALGLFDTHPYRFLDHLAVQKNNRYLVGG